MACFYLGLGQSDFCFVLEPRNLAEGLDSSSQKPLAAEADKWSSSGDTASCALHLGSLIGDPLPGSQTGGVVNSKQTREKKQGNTAQNVPVTGKVYLRVSGILHTFVNDGEIVTSSAV